MSIARTSRVSLLVALVAISAALATYAFIVVHESPRIHCLDSVFPHGLQGITKNVSRGETIDCCGVLVRPVPFNASFSYAGGLLDSNGETVGETEVLRVMGDGRPMFSFVAGSSLHRNVSLPFSDYPCPLRVSASNCIVAGSFIVPVNVSWAGLDDSVGIVTVTLTILSEDGNFSRTVIIPLAKDSDRKIARRLVPLLVPDPVDCGGNYSSVPWFFDSNGDVRVDLTVGIVVAFWGDLGEAVVNVTVGYVGVVLPGG